VRHRIMRLRDRLEGNAMAISRSSAYSCVTWGKVLENVCEPMRVETREWPGIWIVLQYALTCRLERDGSPSPARAHLQSLQEFKTRSGLWKVNLLPDSGEDKRCLYFPLSPLVPSRWDRGSAKPTRRTGIFTVTDRMRGDVTDSPPPACGASINHCSIPCSATKSSEPPEPICSKDHPTNSTPIRRRGWQVRITCP